VAVPAEVRQRCRVAVVDRRHAVHEGHAGERGGDPLHGGGDAVHQVPSTRMFRNTAAALVALRATATGPSSTSPDLTAPGELKSGSQVCTSWLPTVVTPWKPSRPTR